MRKEDLLTPVNVVGVVALAVGVTLAVTSRGHGGPASPAGAASPVASLTSDASDASAEPSTAASPSVPPGTPVRTATPAGNGASQRIDADRLDGLDSTAFQRRIAGFCAGAVTSVRQDGSLTCRSLPVTSTKVTWNATAHAARAEDVRKVLASFAGGRLVAHCAIDKNKVPTMSFYVEAASGGTVNGYTTSGYANGNGDGKESVTTEATGVQVGKGAGPVRVLQMAPGSYSYERAELSWWIATPRGLTHVEAHAFEDERSAYFDNLCTVWAVVT